MENKKYKLIKQCKKVHRNDKKEKKGKDKNNVSQKEQK